MVIHSRPSIVVGIDGSVESAAALRWALREGAARALLVEVVHCWQRHSFEDLRGGSPHDISPGSVHMLQAETTAALSALQVQPEVVRTSIHERPATALLHRTENAVLLVIGAHHHLGTRLVQRGPVADMSIKWGFCPVVIVDTHENAVSYGENRVDADALAGWPQGVAATIG